MEYIFFLVRFLKEADWCETIKIKKIEMAGYPNACFNNQIFVRLWVLYFYDLIRYCFNFFFGLWICIMDHSFSISGDEVGGYDDFCFLFSITEFNHESIQNYFLNGLFCIYLPHVAFLPYILYITKIRIYAKLTFRNDYYV